MLRRPLHHHPATKMSSGPPLPDAATAASTSTPSAREEGSARSSGRTTYSAEFLLSVACSDACRNLPAGVDASALSALIQAAPPERWDACSSGSSLRHGVLPDLEPDRLDRHPGNQFRHNWYNTEHDGLLGSGASSWPLCHLGPLTSNDQGSGYQLNRNSGLYQPPLPYKAVPVLRKGVDSINAETFGSFECSHEDRVEEERKRRVSFEVTRKEQHKVLQEKKNASDSNKENLGDGIISLLQDSAGKRGPPTKSDQKDELKASGLSIDGLKTSPLLPTPKTRPLKPPGFVNALPEKRLQLQSSNTSLSSESQQLNTDDITISSVPESSKCAKSFLDEVGSGHTEDLSSKNLLSMIVKDENLIEENMVRGPSASDDNLENLSSESPSNCGVSKLLHFISPKPTAGTLKEYSTNDIPEPVPVMTCRDLEQTMLCHVNDTSIPNQENMVHEYQTVLDQPSATEPIAVDQHASRHVLSFLQKGTNSKDSSPEFHIGPTDELLSSNPNGMVHSEKAANPVNKTETTLTLDALFGAASMNGAFHMKPKTGAEYDNTKFSGSRWEGATFDEKSMEIQLPEEDDLFSVDNSLHAQNTHYFPAARPDDLLPEKEVSDLNYQFQSLVPCEAENAQVLGQDLLGSCSHVWRDQVDPNNLYHLFGSSPSAKSPVNSASTMFPSKDHITDRNQQAPFNMPEAIPRFTCSFPQNMNSMRHVLPAPSGPRADRVAHHRVLQHMSMPGSFPPQGLPRGVPLSLPAHGMPGYRAGMNNVNSFQMHPRRPGYGESGMMMAGPPGPEVGVSHGGALERLIQMELRARSRQVHPAMVRGPAQGLYGPEGCGMNFRY